MNPVTVERYGNPRIPKPTLLFVDDEKRVLNSMRAMFRRDYKLFLTTNGNDALKIIEQNSIDVVVADQRMPQMSGVEVLSAVRQQSPATVRILLTGYADLDAVEGAMNESQVFRFLSKPCAADELRGTIKQATQIARDTAAVATRAIEEDHDDERIADIAQQGREQVVGGQLEGLVEGAELDVSDALMYADGLVDAAADLLLTETDESKARQVAVAETRRITTTGPTAQATGEAGLTGGKKSASDGQIYDAENRLETGSQVASVENAYVETVVLPEFPAELPAEPPATDTSKLVIPVVSGHKISVVGTGKYKVSIMVYSSDQQFAKSVGRSLHDYFYTFHASNVAHLMHGITQVFPAVLITDISEDPEVIKQLMANLKQVVPEMITMVASQHRDTALMVDLINFGQVYRFIDKPLSSTACKRHVRAAVRKHIQLRNNPELVQRYQGSREHHAAPLPASIGRLIGKLGQVRNLWLRKHTG